MCRTCTSLPNFASKCAALCGRGLYRDSNNTCTQCPDCEMAGNSTMTKTPTECQKFTDLCLKCSYSSSSKSQHCRSCHSSSFKWNCTQITSPGEQPAKAGSGNKRFRNYYVYVAAGGGALLCTALISTIIFMKKRQSLQKPIMPLWTIELKQDDQVSFTDYNDVDVMYLDDSYLMEPSEVFTTSTDSMDERIGYKDERKGYNTLS
ncbi:uncharacterized protein LOC100889625 [Strongylocentrotus purpuratus]|uniref:Uncharacterized protein n=1 Tax=Strongylocentrotus purpuratus TaxID=7668 RepID=A0A7M7GG56_STRPU|nr:uncharacterized protein LOC100889625 [Strongylocentrotus purpuratus]